MRPRWCDHDGTLLMSLQANVRHAGGIAIFDLSGSLVAGPDSDFLRQTLLDAFERGSHWMLLNCAEIDHIDSAGLGEMVSAYGSIVRRGGMLRLLSPGRRLRELLALSRLDALLEFDDDEPAALASFNSAASARAQRKLSGYLEREP